MLGKRGRPKKVTTIVTDTGRIHRHTIPLIGSRRVKDLVKADVSGFLKDIIAGKTRVSERAVDFIGQVAEAYSGSFSARLTMGCLAGALPPF